MSVGTRLKKARNKLGLSIDDIRDKSKIKKNYLVAIENDNYENLPGEVYTKVYIRGYAKIVGLDPQTILSEYENEKKKNNNEINEDNINNESNKNRKDENSTKADKILKGIIGVILILIIVLLSYNIFFRPDQNQNDTAINNQNTEVVEQETSNNTNDSEEQTNLNQEENSDSVNNNVNNEENANTTENTDQNEVENNDNEQSQPIIKDTSKEFKIIANDKSWLQITIDDDLKYQGFINEDEIMTHNGEETVTLKIGNGIAVQVEINGEVLGPFGKRGEVIIKQFNLN
jgi:cytoskeletal protein RodZ